ncbi:hypothetical protein ACIG5E_37490 [Kitasatospora sp. NPDC053057]|uniref:hypothetical protein n=1 Tax=Kitasatospora sp. NPDC053057 TaxID=3364062 RepID=UPI0037C870BB
MEHGGEEADGCFRVGEFVAGGEDGAEGALGGVKGAPVEDRVEAAGALGEEPGEVAVGAGDGDGESSDGLAQCGEPLDR